MPLAGHLASEIERIVRVCIQHVVLAENPLDVRQRYSVAVQARKAIEGLLVDGTLEPDSFMPGEEGKGHDH